MKTPRLIFGAALVLVTAGCGDDPITAYRVRHEAITVAATTSPAAPAAPAAVPSAPAVPAPMAGMDVQTATGPALVWTAPAGWIAKPVTAMRKGSYTVPAAGGEADCSITAFPGAVGGELANLNRWRGQLQLAPLTAEQVPANVRRENHGGLEFVIVDISAAGENPAGILGAMVPAGDVTWFFKLSGPAATLAAAKPEFLEFLQTVRPATP